MHVGLALCPPYHAGTASVPLAGSSVLQLARGNTPRALLLLALLFCQREGGREARAAQSGCAVAWAASAHARMFAGVRLRGGARDAAKHPEEDSDGGSEQTRSGTTGSDTSMREDSDASMREEAEDTGPLSAKQLEQLRALSVAELIPLCEPESVPHTHPAHMRCRSTLVRLVLAALSMWSCTCVREWVPACMHACMPMHVRVYERACSVCRQYGPPLDGWAD